MRQLRSGAGSGVHSTPATRLGQQSCIWGNIPSPYCCSDRYSLEIFIFLNLRVLSICWSFNFSQVLLCLSFVHPKIWQFIIWVWTLARALRCVLRQDSLLSPCLSPPRCINGYSWVPANLLLGVTLHWSSIPSRETRNTPSCLFCTYYLVKKGHLSKKAQETHTVELEEYFKNWCAPVPFFPGPSCSKSG